MALATKSELLELIGYVRQLAELTERMSARLDYIEQRIGEGNGLQTGENPLVDKSEGGAFVQSKPHGGGY